MWTVDASKVTCLHEGDYMSYARSRTTLGSFSYQVLSRSRSFLVVRRSALHALRQPNIKGAGSAFIRALQACFTHAAPRSSCPGPAVASGLTLAGVVVPLLAAETGLDGILGAPGLLDIVGLALTMGGAALPAPLAPPLATGGRGVGLAAVGGGGGGAAALTAGMSFRLKGEQGVSAGNHHDACYVAY